LECKHVHFTAAAAAAAAAAAVALLLLLLLPAEGFWCSHPGMGVSLVVYLLMLLIAHAHSVTLFFM
jgi:hypothetical protein